MNWLPLLTFLLILPIQAEEVEMHVPGKSIPVRLTGIPNNRQQEIKRILEEQLLFAPDATPSPPLADDLAYFVRLDLTNHGWKAADVLWEIQGGEILLKATAGEPILLGKITWSGDASPVPTPELEALLLRPLHEAHGKTKLPWVEETVDAGVSLVERRLQAEGHLQARASLDATAQNAVMNATITLAVGTRTVFRNVSLTGFPESTENAFATPLSELQGQPCNQAKLDDLGRKIAATLQKEGWLAAKVTSQISDQSTLVQADATLLVQAGSQTSIVEIEAAENFSVGAQRVLCALFRPMEGKIWEARELELHFRRALDSGLFTKLDYTAEPLPAAAPLPNGTIPSVLRLTGTESDRYQFGLSGGFDSFLGPFVGAHLSGVNLADTGARWRIAGEFGGFGPAGSVAISDPALFGSRFSGAAETAIQHMMRYDYTSTTLGGKLALGRRVSLPLSYSLEGSVLLGSSHTSTLDSLELGPDVYAASSLAASLQWDRRDSPVLPTKGWNLETKLEGTQLADDRYDSSFLRGDFRVSFFQPLGRTWRFGLGLNASGIIGPTVEKLPIDMRIFNGGGQSVRSFGERQLGPISRTGTTPLGGTLAMTVSAEISREIASNLDLAFFVDAGGLRRDGKGGVPPDIRYAVGLGLRYKLPFGPLRLDYGWNPDRRSHEPFGTVHVALGLPF